MLSVKIVLCYSETSDLNIVHQIAYGIEEEGLPYLIMTSHGDVYRNAETAANQSSLDVGIGIDSKKLAIRNRRFKDDVYLFDRKINDINDLKAYGANAARLIKGVPFKQI